MAFVLHFLRAGDLFADVGANIGSYTILASGIIGCHTVAFEPDPATAAALERNISLNKIAERVELRIAAVGHRDGAARFSIGLDTENHVLSGADAIGRSVPMQSLDRALFGNGRVPILIKMDVEGHEAEVLRGARAVLGEPGLKAILRTIGENAGDSRARIGRPLWIVVRNRAPGQADDRFPILTHLRRAAPFIEAITPLVITFDEVPNIARTIDKLAWARRIVVLDNGSTDGTLDVLARYPHIALFKRAFEVSPISARASFQPRIGYGVWRGRAPYWPVLRFSTHCEPIAGASALFVSARCGYRSISSRRQPCSMTSLQFC